MHFSVDLLLLCNDAILRELEGRLSDHEITDNHKCQSRYTKQSKAPIRLAESNRKMKRLL